MLKREVPTTIVSDGGFIYLDAKIAHDSFGNIVNIAEAVNALYPGAAEPSADAERPIVAEYYFPAQALSLFEPDALVVHRDRLGRYLRRLRSIESGGLRLIWSSDGAHELYDLVADPTETRNLAGDPRFAARERKLRAGLEAFVAQSGGPRPLPGKARRLGEPRGAFKDLDSESAELLRGLGYRLQT